MTRIEDEQMSHDATPRGANGVDTSLLAMNLHRTGWNDDGKGNTA
jgi:hypothetical protein